MEKGRYAYTFILMGSILGVLVLSIPLISASTFSSMVSQSSDDAEEGSRGIISLSSSDLELINAGANQVVGIRFNDIDIPGGSVINDAYIQFTADETSSGATSLIFNAQDVDDAPGFSSSRYDISLRTRTSASVEWNNVPSWSVVGESGYNQRTPNLNTIIQEVVDRDGWAEGNSIAFIVTGSGRRTAESYNGAAGHGDLSRAPLLVVDYSPTANAVNDAEFVSQSVPSSMTADGDYQVTVSMKNTGGTVWDENYRLGSQNPQDNNNWGTGRVFMDDGETVNPGETKDFTFWVTAPLGEGQYNFQWRMVDENVEWFGEFSDNLQINVISEGTEPAKIFAQYHIWYGRGECPDGYWDQWHWGGTEDDPCQTRFGSPWLRQISSPYYPLIGPYNSYDPEVMRWHIKLAKAAGIDGFLVSVFYDEPDFLDIFEQMLSVANEEDFKLGIEGWMPSEGDEVAYMEKVRQQIDSYSQNNAYLKINGKPVYMFNFYAEWLSNNELIDFLNSREAYWIVESDMDTAPINNALSGSEIHLAKTTFPGFDERMISNEPGRDYRSSPRNLGQVLRDSLFNLENDGADAIVVLSFNDWNEATMIEPGYDIEEHMGEPFLPHQEVIFDGDPYRYLKIIADFKGVPWIEPEISCSIVDDLILEYNPYSISCSDGQTDPLGMNVLAFYYGWYGNETEGWKHWESPSPVGTTTYYTPSLGFYSSLDRGVIEHHVDWAKGAGIDGFIFSWWQLDDELGHYNAGLQTLLDVAEEKNFIVSVYIETEEEATVAEQINYLISQGYVDSPAWYRKEGKPVFYIWAAVTAVHEGNENPADDYWYQTKQQTIIPVYLNAHKFSYAYPHGVDALHTYVYFDQDMMNDGYLEDFLWNVGGINQGDYSMTVNPGFQSIGDDPAATRNDGDRYRNQWDVSLNLESNPGYPGYGPDEVLITSWNEWHESSGIEPTTDWGTQYLEITSEYTGAAFNSNCSGGGVEGEVQSCDTGELGICGGGAKTCLGGFWGDCVRVNDPETEICDGIDNNCDGQTDEGGVCVVCIDNDGDGYGQDCSLGADCDDSDPGVNPGATEACSNGIDDDCDGSDPECVAEICSDCGIGLLNFCDRDECNSIAEGCYFRGGLINECASCSEAACEDYGGDQQTCSEDACGLGICGWNGIGCVSYECNDGIDNDGDGQIDYPNDAGCLSSTDDDESNCGDGVCESSEDYQNCFQDCFHPADIDQSGCVNSIEFIAYTNKYENGEGVTLADIEELMCGGIPLCCGA